MAAYAAAASLHRYLLFILNNFNAVVHPLILKTTEFGCMKLNSFKKWMERLDIQSRKRMNASLGRIAEEIREFEEYCVSEEVPLRSNIECEFEEYFSAIVEQLKKVEEEYYNFPEEEEEVVSKSKIVGLCDQRRQLKDDIMAPFTENPVYSIAGMAGIGKTTLAQELFDDLDVSEWFDCRAWITAGIEFKPKEIIEFVLAQVDPEAHKMMIKGGDEEEISEGLKQYLEDKRYLIVLDDVWNEDVYDYLQRSLPHNENGSRVLLATRMKYVAQNYKSYEHINMRLLDKEESWDLLHEKVFAEDSCPPHLHDFGKIIAEKCDGLPLMIVTVADLLSKAEEPQESLWNDIATKKKHQLFIDAYDQISEVLYPSYNILDDDHKLCFLYLGAFPLKYEIPKSKLINLWIAEDFFELSTNGTLESFAIKILDFLDSSCIIMVYQRSSTLDPITFVESVKTCGLHSVWWHFCQIEARKTNCFHVLDCYNKDDLEKSIKGHSRLSIHYNVLFALKDVHNAIEKICARSALSLLCFGPYSQYMVPVCFGLKSLLRLDALNIRFYDFPLQVLELVMIRYLALTCNGKLPSSVSRLKKLQYLIVHSHLSIKAPEDHSHMPVEIWDLEELKHVEVMGCDLQNFGDTSLLNLLTLSGVTQESCIILKRVPNLKKLGIRIELTPDVMEPLFCFDHISHLTVLESLKCVIVNPKCKPEISSFPRLSIFLVKLSLSGMGYPWEEMRKVASLPNLQVLKLRFNAFQGPKWIVKKDEFPNLYSLLIEDIDLLKLRWQHGSFKKLGLLRMKHCYKFKDLKLGDLSNIRKIEVVDCNPMVEWHAQRFMLIKDIFTLLVHSSWKS